MATPFRSLMLAQLVLHARGLVLSSTSRRHAILGAAATAAATTGCFDVAPAAAAASVQKTWKLANGVLMPTLCLNTAGLSAVGSERATLAALAAGITHVDFHPGIERDGVAKALAASQKRSSLFLTTKIGKPKPGTSPAAAAELVNKQLDNDLSVLGIDKVDMLMLRDSPDCEVMQAQWREMEGVLASGRARSIGVINYCEGSLSCLLSTAKVKPAINYIMQHVGMGKDALGLRAFGESKGIRTFAYGALGEPGPEPELLASAELKQIGEKHKRSVEEVALRWVLQGGCAVSVRPTAEFGLGRSFCVEGTCADGLRTRAQAFDWELSAEEMARLNAVASPSGSPTLFSSTFCPDSYFARAV
jgi:diketogulonate reductase-like aldo/keto reductase